MLHLLGICWFFITTVLFFKATVLGLVFLNAVLLVSAWRTRTLPVIPPKALIFWGIISCLLLAHTTFLSVDPAFSFPLCVRFITLLLQVACLQMWISKPEFIYTSLNMHPNVHSVFPFFLLLVICFIALQVQFFDDGLLTRTLNTFVGTTLPVPRTFKPYLAILTLGFFLFMGISERYCLGTFRLLPSFFLGVSFLVVGALMSAYTNCLALILGFCTFFACRWFPRFTIAFAGIALFSSLFILPFILHHLWDNETLRAFIAPWSTFGQRALHWSEISPLLTEKFFTGGGLGYSYVLSQGKNWTLPLMYPHNMALELWIDLGLFGALSVGILLGILLWNLYKSPHRTATETGMALLIAAFTMAQTGYSNIHLWWASALSICSFFIQVYDISPHQFISSHKSKYLNN